MAIGKEKTLGRYIKPANTSGTDFLPTTSAMVKECKR
jgi:hypothetical protein